MFVSLEGIDGAGKSTQAKLLAGALGPDTLLLREPGGTPVGERLRGLLKDPATELSARTELLLFTAARAELVESVIRPALAAGRAVVCDRFMDSTVAYQGSARGLGVELVAELNRIAVGDCRPDRTVLLRLSPGEADSRGAGRGEFGSDRFERQGSPFRAAVAQAFEDLAAAEPQRFVVVEASGGVDQVHRQVLEALAVGG